MRFLLQYCSTYRYYHYCTQSWNVEAEVSAICYFTVLRNQNMYGTRQRLQVVLYYSCVHFTVAVLIMYWAARPRSFVKVGSCLCLFQPYCRRLLGRPCGRLLSFKVCPCCGSHCSVAAHACKSLGRARSTQLCLWRRRRFQVHDLCHVQRLSEWVQRGDGHTACMSTWVSAIVQLCPAARTLCWTACWQGGTGCGALQCLWFDGGQNGA